MFSGRLFSLLRNVPADHSVQLYSLAVSFRSCYPLFTYLLVSYS